MLPISSRYSLGLGPSFPVVRKWNNFIAFTRLGESQASYLRKGQKKHFKKREDEPTSRGESGIGKGLAQLRENEL